MPRYLEGWAKHNSSAGYSKASAVGARQSGMNYVAYALEHPKAVRCVYTRKGELNKRYHIIIKKWRGNATN